MSNFKLTGTVKTIKDTVQVTEKFSKRELVINDASSMYPQDILFELAQDNTSKADGFKTGETVEVSFNLRGREWTSPQGEVKYFNTLDAWRIEKVEAVNMSPSDAVTPVTNEADDLPF